MKRITLTLTALVALAIATSASAATYFGFSIGVNSAPPPPRVVYYGQPDLWLEPSTQVYIVRNAYDDDDDIFRYGPYYYVCHDDYWYRSSAYRGPFVAVDVRAVPQPIFRVPAQRWHRYPMALARYQGNRGYGRGYGYGNNDQYIYRTNRVYTPQNRYPDRYYSGRDDRYTQRDDRYAYRDNDRWNRDNDRWNRGNDRGDNGNNRGGNHNRDNGRDHGRGRGHGHGDNQDD